MDKIYYIFRILLFVLLINNAYAYEVITIRHQDLATYSTILKSFNQQLSHKQNYIIKHFNGNDNIEKVKNFINTLKTNKPDLILSIGSITSQIVIDEIKDIPIIITGLGSPSMLISNWETSNANYTGVELKDGIYHALKILNPLINIRTIGIMCVKNEPSHIGARNEVDRFAQDNGLAFRTITLLNRDNENKRLSREQMTQNIITALDTLLPQIDTLFLNISKTYVDNIELIKAKLRQYRVLSIGSSIYFGSGITIGIESDYVLRGQLCADYVIKILELKQLPKSLPFNMIPNFTIDLDLNEASKVGFVPNMNFIVNKVNLHIR